MTFDVVVPQDLDAAARAAVEELAAKRDQVEGLQDALGRAREDLQAAVRDVHRSYRRDLVPVSRAVVRVPRR